jgi:glycine/D-amino acid oxidase-like deaminating enzyme
VKRVFSYWEKKHFWGNMTHVIAGSGITGLTSAIYLAIAKPEAKILILESGLLPSGASTRNAGFACFGSASEVLDDLKYKSENDVFGLIEKRYKGLGMLRALLTDAQLGYEHTGGYEIFLESETALYENCLGSLSYLNAELVNAIGKQAYWDAENKIGSTGFAGIQHMLVNQEEGMLDTGLMMRNLIALAQSLGVLIISGVEIISFDEANDRVYISTSIGDLSAEALLIATNGFAKKLLPELDVEPCRAQVLITEPIPNLKLNGCYHHDRGYNYFRNVDGRVLLGGGRHTDIVAENTPEQNTTASIQDYLEVLLREVILPGIQFEIAQRWSGTMGMGKSKDVILKSLTPRVMCAVRFGGMGVALGSYIGQQAATMLSDI